MARGLGVWLGAVARDVVGLALLGLGLALPWHYVDHATPMRGYDLTVAQVLTAASIGALALVWISRLAPGHAIALRVAIVARVATALAYGAAVGSVMAVDARAHHLDWLDRGGIGLGASMGLAGALVLAMPAALDVPRLTTRASRSLRAIAAASAMFWAGMVVVSFIATLREFDWLTSPDAVGARESFLFTSTLTTLAVAAPLGVTVRGLAKGSRATQRAVVAVAASIGVAGLASWANDWGNGPHLGIEGLHYTVLLLAPAIVMGALASSPAIADTEREDSTDAWLAAARSVLVTAALGVLVLMLIDLSIHAHAQSNAPFPWPSVTSLPMVGLAVACAAVLLRSRRGLVQGFALATLAIGIGAGAWYYIGLDRLNPLDGGALDTDPWLASVIVTMALPLAAAALVLRSLRRDPAQDLQPPVLGAPQGHGMYGATGGGSAPQGHPSPRVPSAAMTPPTYQPQRSTNV